MPCLTALSKVSSIAGWAGLGTMAHCLRILYLSVECIYEDVMYGGNVNQFY